MSQGIGFKVGSLLTAPMHGNEQLNVGIQMCGPMNVQILSCECVLGTCTSCLPRNTSQGSQGPSWWNAYCMLLKRTPSTIRISP